MFVLRFQVLLIPMALFPDHNKLPAYKSDMQAEEMSKEKH